MATSAPDALAESIETTETTPLLLPLSPESQADSPEDGTNGSISSNAALKFQKHSHLYPYVVILAALFSLVADMGGSLIDTPEVRLLEMAVCRDYYRSHDPSLIGPPPQSYVPEQYCKLAMIQRDLAYLRATKSLLMTLPGLVLTFFYGRLADKIGRRPVMLLGMTGQVLCYFWMILVCYFHEALPTKLVLLSPAFLLIGGGVRVLSAIVNTLVVDVSPEDMRTTVFYSIGAAVLITDIVAAPVGSWLLSKDLWLPYWFSTPIILLSYPIILAIPETVSINQDKSSQPLSLQDENRSSPEPRQLPPLKALPAEAYKYIQRSIQAFQISKDITVCLTMIFLNAFSRCSGSVFIQYVSKLLNWPISTTGYLLSAKSAVSLGVLIGLVIITSTVTVKTSTKPLNVDIWVVRSSLALLVAGNLILGFSANAASVITGSVLASGGTGIVQAMQGVVASFAGPSVVGQLYAGVALVELAGGLLGIMAFAGIFDLGLSFEADVGLGLPFLISSILFILTVCISFLLPRRVSTSNSAAAMG